MSTFSEAPHVRQENCYDGHRITPDEVLAAARQHERYLRTVAPRGYTMRVFEDGSVFFQNTKNPNLRRLLSLDDINEEACDFRLSPHRALWQHIFHMWA
jgi:hypothetical protein